jgi:hypothetical protein
MPTLFNAPLVPIIQLQLVTRDIMEFLVMLLVKRVVPDPLQILGPVLGHQRVLYVRRVCIHYRQTLLRVRPVVPDPLQIPGPALGQQRALLVSLACIHYLPTLRRVRPVPPLPTPPLSNAPLVPIKQSQRVTQDIMDLPVMLLAKRVLLVLLQILEQALGQHRVVLALPEVIRCRRTLLHVRPVPPFPTPPLSNAPLVPIKQ